MDRQQVDEAMALMRMEYLEMPELKLTLCQAKRLWNLPADVCESRWEAWCAPSFCP